jgi:PAS domain S-box-containing protein
MPLTLSRELRFRGLVPALPWLAFACCLLATLGLWAYMLYAQHTRIQAHTAAVAEQARFHLNRGVHQRVNALEYFVEEWPTRFEGRPARYDRRFDDVIALMAGLVDVLWVDEDALLCVARDEAIAAEDCRVLAGPAAQAALRATRQDGLPHAFFGEFGFSHQQFTVAWAVCDATGNEGGFLLGVVDLDHFGQTYLSESSMMAQFNFAIMGPTLSAPAYLHGNFAALQQSRFALHLPLAFLDAPWSLSFAPAPHYLWQQRIPGLSLLPLLTVVISLVVALLMRALPKRKDALWRSEQRLRQIIDLLPHLVYARDASGRFLMANQAFADALGKELDEILDSTLCRLHPIRSESARFDADDQRTLAENHATETSDQRLTDAQGLNRHYQIARIPVTLWDTRESCVMGIAVDVTERTREEQELQSYRTQLEALVRARTAELEQAQGELVRREKLATLGRLMATVSHELRNPLGTIATALFTIRHAIQGAGLVAAERAAERAERNVHRCGGIIEELLDFARSHPPHFQKVDFDEWLTHTIEEYTLPDGIDLELQRNAGVVMDLDKDRMQRCVINLLDNAVHAIAEAGEQGPAVRGQLGIQTSVEDGSLYLRVRDNGPGIPEAERDRVFEPLFSTRSFGVGLGLPIVRQIVEQHDGQVWLEDAPGGGIVAVVRLPSGNPEQRA